MNFLLHFHLAELAAPRPGFALGAMLPDLWRMAARPARARREVTAAEPPSTRTQATLEGIAHHLRVDGWFHKTPHFHDGDELASKLLAATESPRMGLFGHITWEMCLDGALLRAHGLTRVAARVKGALDHEQLEASRAAADLHHGDARARSSVDPEVFDARMRRLFAALTTFDLPRGYADALGTAERLAGVRSMFRMPRPSPEELSRWVDAITRIHTFADERIEALIEDGRRVE